MNDNHKKTANITFAKFTALPAELTALTGDVWRELTDKRIDHRGKGYHWNPVVCYMQREKDGMTICLSTPFGSGSGEKRYAYVVAWNGERFQHVENYSEKATEATFSITRPVAAIAKDIARKVACESNAKLYASAKARLDAQTARREKGREYQAAMREIMPERTLSSSDCFLEYEAQEDTTSAWVRLRLPEDKARAAVMLQAIVDMVAE